MIGFEDQSFRKKLTAEIEECIAGEAPIVLKGQCKDFEEYLRRSTRIGAFNEVLAMIEDILDAARRPPETET